MAKKRVCEICGTVFDENRDVCPLCDTPYQADLDETQVFSAAELEAAAAAGKKKKQKRQQEHFLKKWDLRVKRTVIRASYQEASSKESPLQGHWQ